MAAILLSVVCIVAACAGAGPSPSSTASGAPEPSPSVIGGSASADPTASHEATTSAPAQVDGTPRPSRAAPTGTDEAVDPVSGLPWVDLEDLPPEAADTLERIESGGPFPFDRDGITFQNREGILPEAPAGAYREYTVVTPGEDDRGARRIVTGRESEVYFTDDHYRSFVRIRMPDG